MLNKLLSLSAFSLLLLFQNATAQFLPPIACPEYFQYQKYANQVIGKVTLPRTSPGTTKLDIEFSQQQSLETAYYGRVTLYQDEDTTVNNINSGLPISYRVDFPIPESPPKLTKIFVNDHLICVGSPYFQGSTTMIKLQHTLRTTTRRIIISDPLSGDIFQQQPTFPQVTQPPPPRFEQVPPRRQPQVPTVQQTPPSQRPATIQNETRPVSTNINSNINSVCGVEGSSTIPLVYGGGIVSRGELPWLTPIFKKLAEGPKFICGGSLISARTIITAAHCFTITSLRADQIVVFVGRYKLDSFTESGYEPRELTNLLINPDYDPNIYPDADIALLQMNSAVSFTAFIKPICLWTNPTSVVGETGYIAGWGSEENGNAVSPVPKMATANIVSEAECLKSDGFFGLTSSRTLCAGNRDGTGPCKGDSGGGLMIKQNGRWLLRGIVSAGKSQNSQCDLNQYVIYCDLAKHQTWIQNNISN